MTEYRKNGHSVWDVKYHIIWVTKYRYKVLRVEVATRTGDLLRQICQGREVVIVQGAVSPDHVHILVSVPPQLAPAKLVQYLKGRSSRMLQDEFPQLKKRYWGQHLGRAGTSARRLARWTKTRSGDTSRISNGTTRARISRSPRPPSLKPALSRRFFRRLQPQTGDFQSQFNPPAFSRWSFSFVEVMSCRLEDSRVDFRHSSAEALRSIVCLRCRD